MKDAALEIAFAGGIDQSRRAEIADPRASFVALENVRSPTVGAVEKRQGFDPHTGVTRFDSSSRSAGYRMFSHGRQTCVIDGHIIDVAAASANISKDRVPECLATRVPLPWPGFNASGFSNCIYANGYIVVAVWTTGATSITLFVLDATTYAIVSGPTTYTGLTSFPDGPQIVAVDTTAVVIYRSASATLTARTIDLTSATTINTGWSSGTNLATDFGGGDGFDAIGMEDRFAIAHGNTSGGASRLTIRTFDTSLVQQETRTVNTSSTDVAAVALAGVNARLWIGYSIGPDVYIMAVQGDSLSILLASALNSFSFSSTFPSNLAIVPATAGSGRIIGTENATGVTIARSFTTSAGAATNDGSAQTWYNIQLLTRPWRLDGRSYATVFYGNDGSNPHSTHFVVDIDSTAAMRPVATLAPRLATSTTDGASQQVAVISSTKVAVSHVVSRTGGLGIGQGRAVEVVFLDFAAPNRWMPATFGGNVYMTGGFTAYFDGHRLREANFLVRPLTPSAAGGVGTGVTGTNLRYIVVPEKFDANGNCEMGSPSDPSGTVSPTNDSVTVTIPTIPVTAQQDSATTDTENPIRFAVYRSGDNGAEPYHRCGVVNNVTTAATVTYSDTTTDVTSNATMYRQPGTLGTAQSRVSPPGFHFLVPYGDMLVGVGDDLVTLWCSGQYIVGEGVWFADVLQYPVTEGGHVTALAVQDGTLFVFKRDRVFAMAGEPPVDNASTGGLGTPSRLAVDVGARSPFTCVTALGVFFISERGIELLTRARQIEFIGQQVQDTFDDYPYVTSMTYDPHSACVLIEASSTYADGLATGDGRTFVYDTTTRVWRSFDRRAVSATADVPAQDGCMVWNGSEFRYAWLRSNGHTYVETTDHKLDPGSTRVRQYAKTSWVHLGGIQGEQIIDRVLLLGEAVEDHDLEIGVANDYDDTFVSETYDSDVIAALPIYNIDKDIPQQTGQSIMVELEDATPSGDASDDPTGDGAKWIALTFNGGVKGGVKRAGTALRGGT